MANYMHMKNKLIGLIYIRVLPIKNEIFVGAFQACEMLGAP